MPTLVHPKPYFHSFIPLETYHASSLRLSLGLFLEMFDFLSRLGDILLNHENFGTSETILPFIRIAWNLPCIFFATIPRTVFLKLLKFQIFLLGFGLFKSRTWTILLTFANFGKYETILPFIRSAWNLPWIFFATIPRTTFWNFLIFPIFLLGFRLFKSRT